VRRVQGDSATRVIVGFDRHSVKTATRDAAYVAGSRGREFCEVQVESISELSQIQNRCGDRKAVMEIALDPSREMRPELREMLTKVEAAKVFQHTKAPTPVREKHQVDLQAGKQVRQKRRAPVVPQHVIQPEIERTKQQERGIER